MWSKCCIVVGIIPVLLCQNPMTSKRVIVSGANLLSKCRIVLLLRGSGETLAM